jgi:hypothetical protein
MYCKVVICCSVVTWGDFGTNFSNPATYLNCNVYVHVQYNTYVHVQYNTYIHVQYNTYVHLRYNTYEHDTMEVSQYNDI